MRIWIQGESEMDCFLKEICAGKGMILSGPEECDLAVLKLPFSSVDRELAEKLPRGQKIVCGIADEQLDRISKEKDWNLFCPLQDEIYLSENASMTAEGAVAAAMGKMTVALRDAKCLVIGYGRIGKELTRLLRSFGAEVTVAARRQESRMDAGENSVAIKDVRSVIRRMDLILNTVPSLVLSESSLFLAKNTTFLIELASKPYGFDMNRARSLGLRAYLESGLPGRYCPESAAAALLRFIERSVQLE